MPACIGGEQGEKREGRDRLAAGPFSTLPTHSPLATPPRIPDSSSAPCIGSKSRIPHPSHLSPLRTTKGPAARDEQPAPSIHHISSSSGHRCRNGLPGVEVIPVHDGIEAEEVRPLRLPPPVGPDRERHHMSLPDR